MMRFLSIFVLVLLWSTGFIGAKYGLPHAGPLSFLLVRYLLEKIRRESGKTIDVVPTSAMEKSSSICRSSRSTASSAS